MPTALSEETVYNILQYVHLGKTDREIAKLIKVHHNTVASYRRKEGIKPNGSVRQTINKIDDAYAVCSRCCQIKPLSTWPKAQDGNKTRYLLSYCRDCRTRQIRLSQNKTEEKNLYARWMRLKVRCKKTKVNFEITFEEFWNQWQQQNGLCFYTDTPMYLWYGDGSRKNSCSVDRIEPGRGYIAGNVVFSCYRINSIKRDVTLSEMKQWMPSWHARIAAFMKQNNPKNFALHVAQDAIQ